MANSLFKTPGFNPQVKHNGFDMSMRRLFTAPCGMMLPVYTDIVQANDKYKLNVDAFIRTEAVQTAAFQNFKAHFDWFFVPFRQMYQYWNEFYNGTFDANTNYVAVSDEFKLPIAKFDFSGSYIYGNDLNDFYFVKESDDGKYYVQTALDEFGVPRLSNAVRLSDMLGYGDLHRFSTISVKYPSLDLFPYKYLAYHKIFSHPKYQRTDWFQRKTELFNVDSYHGSTVPPAVAHKIFSTMHYRPWRRDYFSGIFPNPVFSKDFQSIVGDSWLKDSLYPISSFSPEYGAFESTTTSPNRVGNANAFKGSDLFGTRSYLQLGSSGAIDVDSLNALYDFDKLCRITALAGSHYTDQLEAHFGVKINNDIHNEAYYIGSQSVDISISEVVSTSSTGAKDSAGKPLVGTNLGDIAGKGFGASNKGGDLNFEAKEQGVLMCVFSIEPLQMYSSSTVERNGLYKEPLDFYRRELDNLGMQVLTQSELVDTPVTASSYMSILGYQYRYSELKTKVDVVNLGFSTVKKDWQCNFQEGISFNSLNTDYRFYINPSFTDNIFAMDFSKGPVTLEENAPSGNSVHPWFSLTNMLIYEGDNFLINAKFNVLKDSIMSVHSLPSLN